MDSPNLVIANVTESPKEGSKARLKQDEQQQQEQQELEVAEKSAVSSTKPELGEAAGHIKMGCTHVYDQHISF